MSCMSFVPVVPVVPIVPMRGMVMLRSGPVRCGRCRMRRVVVGRVRPGAGRVVMVGSAVEHGYCRESLQRDRQHQHTSQNASE
jgi:hypothetical protein